MENLLRILIRNKVKKIDFVKRRNLVTLKSCDTTKQSDGGWQYILFPGFEHYSEGINGCHLRNEKIF